MTPDDTLTGLVQAYLETYEGSTPLPAGVRDAVRARVREAAAHRSSRWPTFGWAVARKSVTVALGVAAVVMAVAIGIGVIARLPSGPGTSATPSPSPAVDLGVFEAARGRILFRVGEHFRAVDPGVPGLGDDIEYGRFGPGDNAMPAGWSADGSTLAVTDEYHGDAYTMAADGVLKPVRFDLVPALLTGCCSFTTSAWLSPDGTRALVTARQDMASGRVYVLDLDNTVPPDPAGRYELAGGEASQPAMAIWSPDGKQAAFVWSKGARLDAPAVGVMDLETGVSRELASGWGVVRQIAWSPDGSQILVIASRETISHHSQLNPLVNPLATSLFLVDVADSEVRAVATGHYVAAAWSPEGSRIAAIDYPGERNVVVLRADGSGKPLPLAELPGDDLFTGVVWNPAPAR